MKKSSSGSVKCGWCITSDHENCLPKLEYFDKVWLCDCTTCYVPTEQEEETNENPELVQEPIQEQG